MSTLALLLALCGAALADPEVHDPDTVVLTASNFDSFVSSEVPVLVEFYAPWCGHCKKLAPEYAKAATALLRESPPLRIGKVDATVESALGSKYGVTGYPTLKIFRSGVATDYKGPRDAAGIITFMKRQALPPARTLASGSDEEVQKWVRSAGGLGFVGVFPDTTSAAAKAFVAAASTANEHFPFAIATDSEASASGRIQRVVDAKGIYVGEMPVVTFDGAVKTDALTAWIYTSALPLAGVAGDSWEAAFQRGTADRRVYVVLPPKESDPISNPSAVKYHLSRLRKAVRAAGESDSDLLAQNAFAVASTERVQLSELGLDSGAWNVVVVNKEGKRYPLPTSERPSKFSAEAVVQFAQKVARGEVEPFIKSEPVPASQTGDVTVLVARNFEAETEGKDALVEFYAPWCGHCKSLAPKYDQLGRAAKTRAPGVVIGKFDATANDVPSGFEVRGFPTIYFVSKDGKKEAYNGGRETKDFVKFLKGKGLWLPKPVEKVEEKADEL